MGQTKAQRVVKQLAGDVQKQTAIATDMFIPNHSGDNSAGDILSTPINNTDIPNKKYVDDEIDGDITTHAAIVDAHHAKYTDAEADARVDLKIEDGTAAGQMSFWNGTKWVKTETSEMFWDDVNKRLGIGTASPSLDLHIDGGLITDSLRIIDGSKQLYVDGGVLSLYSLNGINFQTYDGGVNTDLYINDGKVGIGTTTPGTYTLNVAGNIKGNDIVTNSGSVFKSTGEAYFQSAALADLHFRPAASEKMIIKHTTGNVGIGTTSPDTKLQVVGAISSATLTVTASADDTDVSGVNTMFITTSGGAVVLGGLKGGVAGQVLYIARKDATNDLTLEHAEGVGTQDLIMHEGTDETIDSYGGFTLICDGSDWYDCSHAKHV